MAKSSSGGGSTSRNVVRPGVKNGMPATRINPRGVSQLGSSMGNHSMDSGSKKLTKAVEPVRGAAMPGVKLGNEVAKNVGGGGPGAGRQVMGSGTQGQHGGVAGSVKPAGRDILSEFGNDSAGVRGRR
jgi:hypothetical protein